MANEGQPFKDEKTEDPTPKKMRKARSDGNVFLSQEMATVLVIFFAAWILRFTGPWIFQHLYTILVTCFDLSATFRVGPDNFHDFFLGVLIYVAWFVLPISFLLMFTGGMSTLLQTGWVVSWKKAHWKPEKVFSINWKALNPIDPKKVVDLGLNIAKIAVLGWVLIDTYRDSISKWLPYLELPMEMTWIFLFKLMFWVVMRLCFWLFIIALLDHTYKYKKWFDDMKMTKWQVKDEKKSVDGDPRIKAAIRSRRLALFRKIMMEAIPRADVVITNPTHFAVAVQYNPEEMEAPKVVAKGAGKLAARIKEIAKEHGIPIIENKALAQVLFKTVEVGSFIPTSLYKSVAEILAYVYRLKNKTAA